MVRLFYFAVMTPETIMSLDLDSTDKMSVALVKKITEYTQRSLDEYKDRARSEEDGCTTFSNCVLFQNCLVDFQCRVRVPLTPEYQKDVDDYYFVQEEDVEVDQIVIEHVEKMEGAV